MKALTRFLLPITFTFALIWGACDSGPVDSPDPPEPPEESAWSKKENMPTGRYLHACGVINNKIYVFGGVSTPGPALASVEVYDPTSDSWSQVADMPTPRVGLSIAVVNGKVLTIGGNTSIVRGDFSAVHTVEMYDPATDAWSPVADLPTARAGASASVVDGIVYNIGGYNADEGDLDVVEAYDSSTNEWTPRAPMSTKRRALSTCPIEQKILALGSTYGDTAVEIYDPSIDGWAPGTAMSKVNNGYFGVVLLDGLMYVVGGSVVGDAGVSPAVATMIAYDPGADTWIQKPSMPTPRFGLCAASAGGKLYAIGGSSVFDPGNGLRSVQEYDPDFQPE